MKNSTPWSGDTPTNSPHAAAERALEIGTRTYGSVKSILANNLDRHPARERPAEREPILHTNIRGPRYYN